MAADVSQRVSCSTSAGTFASILSSSEGARPSVLQSFRSLPDSASPSSPTSLICAPKRSLLYFRRTRQLCIFSDRLESRVQRGALVLRGRAPLHPRTQSLSLIRKTVGKGPTPPSPVRGHPPSACAPRLASSTASITSPLSHSPHSTSSRSSLSLRILI